MKWLKNRVEEETAKDYINRLDKYLSGIIITEPKQLADIFNNLELKGQRVKFAKAVRNLLNFYIETYGIDESQIISYRKVVPIEKFEREGVKTVEDADIVEAWNYFKRNLSDDLQLIFKLLVYTGLRLRHILRMLQTFNKANLVVVNKKVARYNISYLSKGGKKAFWAYMPAMIVNELKPLYLTENVVKKNISFETSKGRKITPHVIRVWHDNFMARNRIEKDIRNFIQGRISGMKRDVEAGHYLDLLYRADEEYTRIVDKFPI